MSDFEKCVKRKALSYAYKIDCVLGLWSIEGDSKTLVESEAFNYFRQYESDGEYSSIIGGKSVTEKLKEN